MKDGRTSKRNGFGSNGNSGKNDATSANMGREGGESEIENNMNFYENDNSINNNYNNINNNNIKISNNNNNNNNNLDSRNYNKKNKAELNVTELILKFNNVDRYLLEICVKINGCNSYFSAKLKLEPSYAAYSSSFSVGSSNIPLKKCKYKNETIIKIEPLMFLINLQTLSSEKQISLDVTDRSFRLSSLQNSNNSAGVDNSKKEQFFYVHKNIEISSHKVQYFFKNTFYKDSTITVPNKDLSIIIKFCSDLELLCLITTKNFKNSVNIYFGGITSHILNTNKKQLSGKTNVHVGYNFDYDFDCDFNYNANSHMTNSTKRRRSDFLSSPDRNEHEPCYHVFCLPPHSTNVKKYNNRSNNNNYYNNHNNSIGNGNNSNNNNSSGSSSSSINKYEIINAHNVFGEDNSDSSISSSCSSSSSSVYTENLDTDIDGPNNEDNSFFLERFEKKNYEHEHSEINNLITGYVLLSSVFNSFIPDDQKNKQMTHETQSFENIDFDNLTRNYDNQNYHYTDRKCMESQNQKEAQQEIQQKIQQKIQQEIQKEPEHYPTLDVCGNFNQNQNTRCVDNRQKKDANTVVRNTYPAYREKELLNEIPESVRNMKEHWSQKQVAVIEKEVKNPTSTLMGKEKCKKRNKNDIPTIEELETSDEIEQRKKHPRNCFSETYSNNISHIVPQDDLFENCSVNFPLLKKTEMREEQNLEGKNVYALDTKAKFYENRERDETEKEETERDETEREDSDIYQDCSNWEQHEYSVAKQWKKEEEKKREVTEEWNELRKNASPFKQKNILYQQVHKSNVTNVNKNAQLNNFSKLHFNSIELQNTGNRDKKENKLLKSDTEEDIATMGKEDSELAEEEEEEEEEERKWQDVAQEIEGTIRNNPFYESNEKINKLKNANVDMESDKETDTEAETVGIFHSIIDDIEDELYADKKNMDRFHCSNVINAEHASAFNNYKRCASCNCEQPSDFPKGRNRNQNRSPLKIKQRHDNIFRSVEHFENHSDIEQKNKKKRGLQKEQDYLEANNYTERNIRETHSFQNRLLQNNNVGKRNVSFENNRDVSGNYHKVHTYRKSVVNGEDKSTNFIKLNPDKIFLAENKETLLPKEKTHFFKNGMMNKIRSEKKKLSYSDSQNLNVQSFDKNVHYATEPSNINYIKVPHYESGNTKMVHKTQKRKSATR